MQNFREEMMNAEEGLQIGPLIDVVFLLLIYFIATSSLRKPEADLGIRLPGSVAQSTALNMPDEQIIEISALGDVNLNNHLFAETGGRRMPELVEMLKRFRSASELAGSPPMVTISAEDATRHQRVIDVINACGEAGITNLSVSMGAE
jgi:biopolymer transport protein ExbD